MQTKQKDSLEDIFGAAFGDDFVTSPSSSANNELSLEPVIIGDNSQFTLVVEYFEVVQPNSNPSTEEQS